MVRPPNISRRPGTSLTPDLESRSRSGCPLHHRLVDLEGYVHVGGNIYSVPYQLIDNNRFQMDWRAASRGATRPACARAGLALEVVPPLPPPTSSRTPFVAYDSILALTAPRLCGLMASLRVR